MVKTGAPKKTAVPVQAKPKTASVAEKPAAATPAAAKPASATATASKPGPAVASTKTAVAPKAKAAVKPAAKSASKAKSVPVTPAVAKTEEALSKPRAAGMNGHGGKSDKASSKEKPALELREKAKKPKLVRDSFTMPELEYQALGEVKKTCLKAGIEVKKSELLRVGVALVKQLDLAKLKAALEALAPLKAGRPKKEK